MGVCQVGATGAGIGEGSYNRHDNPLKGRNARSRGHHARHIKKIIVKPCAGKPHARFERGSLETGWHRDKRPSCEPARNRQRFKI
jgi:hypothetical protein